MSLLDKFPGWSVVVAVVMVAGLWAWTIVVLHVKERGPLITWSSVIDIQADQPLRNAARFLIGGLLIIVFGSISARSDRELDDYRREIGTAFRNAWSELRSAVAKERR